MTNVMSRRAFIRTSALGVVFIAPGLFANAATAAKQPNIVWIIPDDLGYGDLGCYGCKDIPTPHIDSIATNGAKCERFYAAAPVCTPSRGSMLTGRYPNVLGLTGPLMGHGGMSSQFVTIAHMLKKSGYATGLVGKWHLGYDGESLPNSQGFDEFYGFRGGKIDYFKHTDDAQRIAGDPMGKHDFYDNDKEIFPEGYSTTLFTKRAVKFVEDHKKEPFFLYLAYNAPHYARPGVLQAPDEYVKRFTKGNKPTTRELYTAMVSCMDDGIGELIACLKKNGLEENTIVMFISDNGADPKSGGSNEPLSGGKWGWREGGIRVPMIAQWPGTLPHGRTIREAIHMIDLFPTMLSVTGMATPQDLKLDGLDVLSALKGNASLPKRSISFDNHAVIEGNWKCMGSQLYDVNADPQEKEDQATKYPDILRRLQQLHR